MLRGREILMRHGVSVGAIQTTTRASLSRAREIVDCYAGFGHGSLFLRPLTRLGAAGQAWDSIGYTPDEFLTFYREGFSRIMELNRMGRKFAEAHASIFLAKLLGDVAPNYMELRSPCGAGVGQMAFTASGDVYTCDEGRMMAEMGDQSFRLGNIYENGYDSWLKAPRVVQPAPHRCWKRCRHVATAFICRTAACVRWSIMRWRAVCLHLRRTMTDAGYIGG